VGSEFWKGMVDWVKTTLVEKYGNVSLTDLDFFNIVDTADEVVHIIDNFYKQHNLSPNF
jgi:predicted Rossmann-fold nucleotide-binding protein